jgi:hypothetical protein
MKAMLNVKCLMLNKKKLFIKNSTLKMSRRRIGRDETVKNWS